MSVGAFCATCGIGMATEVLTEDTRPTAEQMYPAPAVTPEQRAERDRQHADALAANARIEHELPDLASQPDPSRNKVRIHFTADGFTWAGRVWYTGQEIEIGPEHPRWESAVAWIRLTRQEQVARYGRVMFEPGPSPYRQLPEGTEVPLPAGSQQGARSATPARAGDNGSLVPL